MAEYIDIDAPIDVAVYQRNRRIQVTLRQILESNDAKHERADVCPVVQCKECKHYEQLDLFRNSPVWSGMCHYWNSHATCEDGFCFKAAKKEES